MTTPALTTPTKTTPTPTSVLGTALWTLAALPVLPGALLVFGIAYGIARLAEAAPAVEMSDSSIARLSHAGI